MPFRGGHSSNKYYILESACTFVHSYLFYPPFLSIVNICLWPKTTTSSFTLPLAVRPLSELPEKTSPAHYLLLAVGWAPSHFRHIAIVLVSFALLEVGGNSQR